MEYFQSYLWRLLQRAGGSAPAKGGKNSPEAAQPSALDILSEMRGRPRAQGEEELAALQAELMSLWATFDEVGATYAGELLAGNVDADASYFLINK